MSLLCVKHPLNVCTHTVTWFSTPTPTLTPLLPHSPELFWMLYLLVFVDDCIEELAVSPARGEVVTAEAWVALDHALRPEKKLLLGRHVIRLAIDLDV